MLDSPICRRCGGSGEVQISSGPDNYDLSFETCSSCGGGGMSRSRAADALMTAPKRLSPQEERAAWRKQQRKNAAFIAKCVEAAEAIMAKRRRA